MAPPPLPDVIVEEILLRVPPDEPALLMRAALACRRWCRLVSSSGFHRRFCAHHRRRRPPMLGAVRSSVGDDAVRFIPTGSMRFRPPCTERRGWWGLDSRHGRVVLIQSSPRTSRFQFDVGRALAVWDPIADKLRQLPALSAPPQVTKWSSLNATVVCACAAIGSSSDCHHLDCPFLVVFLGSNYSGKFAYLYSSKDDAWSEPTSAGCYGYVQEHKLVPHVGNSLYFLVTNTTTILEYNLVTRELTAIHPPSTRKSSTAIHPPSTRKSSSSVVLSAVEGGDRLGCVMLAGYTLCIWAREAAGPDGEMIWVQSRVIEMAPPNPLTTTIPTIVCYRDASGLIYNGEKCGFFATDLKVDQTRLPQDVRSQDNIVPYMGFYTPALGVAPTADDPRDDGASSACNRSS